MCLWCQKSIWTKKSRRYRCCYGFFSGIIACRFHLSLHLFSAIMISRHSSMMCLWCCAILQISLSVRIYGPKWCGSVFFHRVQCIAWHHSNMLMANDDREKREAILLVNTQSKWEFKRKLYLKFSFGSERVCASVYANMLSSVSQYHRMCETIHLSEICSSIW